MQADSSALKVCWRIFIDTLVIVMTLFLLYIFFVPETWLADDWFDDTLPDSIHATTDQLEEAVSIAPDVTFAPLRVASPTIAEPLPARPGAAIYEKVLPSVVAIMTDTELYYGTGTGVVVAEGVVATNYHVIYDARAIVIADSAGDIHPVTQVIATDEARDVALLSIPTTDLPIVPMVASDRVAVGDTTYSLAHPEGLLHTFSNGLVSAIRTYDHNGLGVQLQITNPISQGSSGGALLNDAGQLIGLLTWAVEYEDNIVQVQNLNFATPSDAIADLLTVLAEAE